MNPLSLIGGVAKRIVGGATNTRNDGTRYDPNAPITPIGVTQNATVTSTPAPSGNYVDDGAAGAAAADKAATIYGIDTGISGANDGLNRLGRQEQTGVENVTRDFNDAMNRLIASRTRAKAGHDENVVENLNEYQGTRNKVATGARTWLDGARRTLGANGAGGGSAARYGITNEAQTMATAGNADAQATNNKNIVSLDRNWQETEDQFANSGNDLNRQRDQGVNDLRSGIESKRAELLNTIATLSGQRVLANGGNVAAAKSAAAPYTSRIASILDTIDSLAATPTIREQQVNVARPDLAGYNFAQPGAQATPIQDASLNPLVYTTLFGDPQDDRLLAGV